MSVYVPLKTKNRKRINGVAYQLSRKITLIFSIETSFNQTEFVSCLAILRAVAYSKSRQLAATQNTKIVKAASICLLMALCVVYYIDLMFRTLLGAAYTISVVVAVV